MNPARAQIFNKRLFNKQNFETIKKMYNELDISNYSERLYNMDGKDCRLTLHHQQRVLAAKGTKRVHFIAEEHTENVTIAACVNAVGIAISPTIIFKGKRCKLEYNANLPTSSVVKMVPKGSMTADIFVDFIKHFAKFKSPGKVLLVFDGASFHLDVIIVDSADKNYIVLYCLPSNTTALPCHAFSYSHNALIHKSATKVPVYHKLLILENHAYTQILSSTLILISQTVKITYICLQL